MTYSQLDMITRMLDMKRVSIYCAAKIIAMLNEQPDVSDRGLQSPNLRPSDNHRNSKNGSGS